MSYYGRFIIYVYYRQKRCRWSALHKHRCNTKNTKSLGNNGASIEATGLVRRGGSLRLGVQWKTKMKTILSTNCLGSKVMRVILSKNDLVKAYNRFKIYKDIGQILFPDSKASVKIHKDTSRKILL